MCPLKSPTIYILTVTSFGRNVGSWAYAHGHSPSWKPHPYLDVFGVSIGGRSLPTLPNIVTGSPLLGHPEDNPIILATHIHCRGFWVGELTYCVPAAIFNGTFCLLVSLPSGCNLMRMLSAIPHASH